MLLRCGGDDGLPLDARLGLGRHPWARAAALRNFEICFQSERSGDASSGGRSPEGTPSCFVDGQFQNRAELAQALGLDESCVDADIADHLLSKSGEDGLARLNGDFALAHWQGDAERLLLATDPMGQRSLFFTRVGRGLIVASTVDALLSCPGVDRVPDPDVLVYFLLRREDLAGTRTAWKNITMLPPGHLLIWRDGNVQIRPYYSFVPARILKFRDDREAVEAGREVLDRAVARLLPKDGCVLSTLSGGLDSSAVTATAARLHHGPIHTVTIRHDPTAILPDLGGKGFYDDWERVQPVLSRYPNLIGHAVDATLSGPEEEGAGGRYLPRDWPIQWLFMHAWMFGSLERKAHELGASVVLTGVFGNHTFSYAGEFVPADQLKNGDLLGLMANLRKRGSTYQPYTWAEFKGSALAPLLSAEMRCRIRRLRGRPVDGWRSFTPLNPRKRDQIGPDSLAEALPYRTGSPDLDRQLTALDHARYRRARRTYRTARYPWSERNPFCDTDLMAFFLALPRTQYFRDGVHRSIARRILADRLPASISNESVVGRIGGEWFTWMNRRRDWIGSELERLERSPMAREILDLPRMRALFEDWPASVEEAQRGDRHIYLQNTLGNGLRVGQFILMQEGRN
ncbi:asparagine synthetase B family protein [Methylobacterium sp. 174MFSha1.1]|uniref:asparagine synthase-related protein n=1 Tax=Methylobacterium sp. 174MFSha1.1 TaxID=1502749 RepID=UPI001FCD5753|nr:asparagine synthetase B family protein [Methylobacterium sp. 174MFSha1.1]